MRGEIKRNMYGKYELWINSTLMGTYNTATTAVYKYFKGQGL